jgi:hypothetical protein
MLPEFTRYFACSENKFEFQMKMKFNVFKAPVMANKEIFVKFKTWRTRTGASFFHHRQVIINEINARLRGRGGCKGEEVAKSMDHDRIPRQGLIKIFATTIAASNK